MFQRGLVLAAKKKKGKKSLQNLNTNKPLIAERQAEKYFF